MVTLGVVGAFAWDALRGDNGDEDNGVGDGTETSTAMVTIPDVLDLPEARAVAELEDLDLAVEVVDEPSPDIAEGNVIRVDPAVGSQLPAGTQVTLTVSSGEEMTMVPDIRDLSTEEAARTLAEAGLELDSTVREESSDTVASGLVIEQTPTAGSELAMSSTVSITVSTGAELIRVPSLTGMDWSQAEATLTSLGFVPNVEYLDSEEDEGTVLSMSDQGSELPRGSTVEVQVSNGQLIDMPDITMMERDEALRALRSAGWEAPDSSLVAGDTVATGALVDQGKIAVTSPEAGETFRRDANIDVRYYRFELGALSPIDGPP